MQNNLILDIFKFIKILETTIDHIDTQIYNLVDIKSQELLV
jgi:hypothetical protein